MKNVRRREFWARAARGSSSRGRCTRAQKQKEKAPSLSLLENVFFSE